MKAWIIRLLAARSGATAIEYGLLCAIFAVVIILGFGGFANALANMLRSITSAMEKAWH